MCILTYIYLRFIFTSCRPPLVGPGSKTNSNRYTEVCGKMFSKPHYILAGACYHTDEMADGGRYLTLTSSCAAARNPAFYEAETRPGFAMRRKQSVFRSRLLGPALQRWVVRSHENQLDPCDEGVLDRRTENEVTYGNPNSRLWLCRRALLSTTATSHRRHQQSRDFR